MQQPTAVPILSDPLGRQAIIAHRSYQEAVERNAQMNKTYQLKGYFYRKRWRQLVAMWLGAESGANLLEPNSELVRWSTSLRKEVTLELDLKDSS